ncbi:MAG: 2Fe-2S iron-sulfur cluster-binding protein [Lysobacterales bacterium]
MKVHLLGSDAWIEVAEGETVLSAARRQGRALPYSCLSGRCGSCRGHLVSGTVDYPFNPPQALSPTELATGEVLLCQAVPRSDLEIAIREVDAVRGIPLRRLTVRVERLQRLAADVMGLSLRPEEEPLAWLPGQYLDVLLDDGRRRAFSIANAPRPDGLIELHVRKVSGGGFSEHVFSTLQLGMPLQIEAPLGTFVPRADSDRPMLLVAGGTGFAPIKAIIEHLLRQFAERPAPRPVQLYWGARAPADLYLEPLVQEWALRSWFDYQAVLSEADATDRWHRHGLVHEAVLADHPDLTGYDVYMSGPPALIEAGRHAFAQAGLPLDRLYYDSFDFAPDVLAAMIRDRDRPPAGR